MDAKRHMRLWPPGALIAIVTFGSGGFASGKDVYTATLVVPRGLTSKSARLTVTIDQYSTEEDTAKLRKIYDEQGSEGLFAALREWNKGSAKLEGYPTQRVNHVRIHEGQGGRQVIIVTEQPLYRAEESSPSRPSTQTLGLIQLEMNNQGQGRGSMAEATKVRLTEAGVLQIEAYGAKSIKLEDVRAQR